MNGPLWTYDLGETATAPSSNRRLVSFSILAIYTFLYRLQIYPR